MESSVLAAVVYARDAQALARFYGGMLGASVRDSGPDHATIDCGGFDLVLHRATGAGVTPPAAEHPGRREHAVIRLAFSVADMAACRAAAAAWGGVVDEQAPLWAGADSVIRLGHDPEGNVFELREASRGEVGMQAAGV